MMTFIYYNTKMSNHIFYESSSINKFPVDKSIGKNETNPCATQSLKQVYNQTYGAK